MWYIKKCSKSHSEDANRLDVPKSGPNPVSDQKVDFSRNWENFGGLLPVCSLIVGPWSMINYLSLFYISTLCDENPPWNHPPNPHQFWEKSTFWSETGFGPLLGTSRRLASSECNFEHFLVYQIFTYLGKFDRWPTFDHALIWDSLGQFSFFLHQKIRLGW